ncbi:MAG: HU family DNA-binding protein [Clostridiales bacterium]|nr:HU family DNA-binding protein [Clostridiales bacterium]
MNKAELIRVVAEKADLTLAASGDCVNAVLDAICEGLVEGNEVAIPGFGTFKVTERAARTCRNPKTGETIEVAASKAISFKVSKALNDKLN